MKTEVLSRSYQPSLEIPEDIKETSSEQSRKLDTALISRRDPSPTPPSTPAGEARSRSESPPRSESWYETDTDIKKLTGEE